jgi:hypothetical protein
MIAADLDAMERLPDVVMPACAVQKVLKGQL